jgi:prepilin-type N-terminal cleavage/methylation domain-containing protein
MKYNKDIKGFTLVELSIVLIILGLIIGAVTLGRHLLSKSQLQAVISEMNFLNSAVTQFKDQFDALPGDFRSAGSFWTSVTCANSSSPAGCNGNGDGWITSAGVSGEECYRIWQHLSLAGLIEGNYTATNTKTDHYKSKFPNGYYNLRTMIPFTNYGYRNFLEIGSWRTTFSDSGVLTPIQAFTIDKKIDDGVANAGKVLGLNGVLQAGCSYDYTSLAGANYTLSTTTPVCRVQKVVE